MKRLLIVALIVLAAAALAAAPQVAPPPSFEGRTAETQARLAVSGHFYLELLISGRDLRLMHSGIAVASYPLKSLTLGTPRVLWVSRQSEGAWIDDLWEGVHLDPAKVIQRLKIVPGDAATTPTPEKPGVVPPTLEELTAVPRTFALRAPGDKAIILVLDGDPPGATQEAADAHPRWHDFLAALGLRHHENLRLTAHIAAQDGAAFFRSFPDGQDSVELLVLP